MSGSSLDGLDIAICQFNKTSEKLNWELIKYHTFPFSNELKGRLKNIREASIDEILTVDNMIAKFTASCVAEIGQNVLTPIDYISSHGHTVLHHPQEGYSLQVGNGGTIAAISGIPTICDFRMNDIALGGQGAPIAPIAEKYLFAEHRFFLNLGGIANISIHEGDKILAYDVCPCNQVLNRLANELGLVYDPEGYNARMGKVNDRLLSQWNNMKYFKIQGPKSLDNNWIKKRFYKKIEDLEISVRDALRTSTEFMAQTIAEHIRVNRLAGAKNSIFITGGGAHNDFLMQLIDEYTSVDVAIHKPKKEIVDMKEAILMCLMGFLRAQKVANNIPSVTGASKETIGGALYLP